jgi:hypothetical protein
VYTQVPAAVYGFFKKNVLRRLCRIEKFLVLRRFHPSFRRRGGPVKPPNPVHLHNFQKNGGLGQNS